jgi:hypothetical protein
LQVALTMNVFSRHRMDNPVSWVTINLLQSWGMEAIDNESTESKPHNVGGAPKGSQNHLKHGLGPLKKAVNTLGNRFLDKRTMASKALVQWREDLIRDLGGDVSTQQDAIISLAIKTKLLLDSVDVWLLQQPTLIIKRKKAIIPAVIQRQQLADALSRYMAQLGLQRRTKAAGIDIFEDDNQPAGSTGADAAGK